MRGRSRRGKVVVYPKRNVLYYFMLLLENSDSDISNMETAS